MKWSNFATQNFAILYTHIMLLWRREEQNSFLDFTIIVYGSSCNYLFIHLILTYLLSLSIQWPSQDRMGCQKIFWEKKDEIMRQQKRVTWTRICNFFHLQKFSNPAFLRTIMKTSKVKTKEKLNFYLSFLCPAQNQLSLFWGSKIISKTNYNLGFLLVSKCSWK